MAAMWLKHQHEITAAIADAGFSRLAQVHASYRADDLAVAHEDAGVVLLRCVPQPTKRDVEAAVDMIAAGDFTAAVIVAGRNSRSLSVNSPSVEFSSLEDLSSTLKRLIRARDQPN